ncbi:coiled-coil domain-containing protein 73 [Synchiropus picturatus]
MERRGRAPTGPAETPAESSPSSASEGAGLLLHLLEYKAQLLEAVEELHIRRDAEARFEDQISEVILERQELEWEKESLQHQMKTAAHQHVDSLAKVRKQLRDSVRSSEEEKEKLQALAESMQKEASNLKEELKELQRLKYNLEKKCGELEQKLALQSKSKESHLSQVGELEKRFMALSRQCAVVKQAHGSLEQKVQEAMMTNKKLASANERQQATLLSLTKELEVLNARVTVSRTSLCRPDSCSGALRQQQMQQLQLKIKQQAEVNKTLQEENLLIRAEKQEVVKAMQQTQQLLLTQTQTVCRLEQELHVQEELFQALQLEHQLLGQRSRATEQEEPAGSCSAAQAARPDQMRDLREDAGPPGGPCPVSGEAVLCQDPGALEPGAPPSDPRSSPQCQTPPGEGDEDQGTRATHLHTVHLICSSQLSGSEDVADGEKEEGEEESEQAAALDAAQMASATPGNPEGHVQPDVHSATPQGTQHSEARGSDASTEPSTCRSPAEASPLGCLQDASHRADPSARAGGPPAPGSDSQERRVQQSTLGAQISRLEQLLGAGRLRLPKRRRTDQ